MRTPVSDLQSVIVTTCRLCTASTIIKQAGRTALHAASKKGHAHVVERLLKLRGVDATTRDFIVRANGDASRFPPRYAHVAHQCRMTGPLSTAQRTGVTSMLLLH